ncbi:DUF1565 domain-containing protein, partial [Hymenobacter sp. AT01-02]|uniref:DUF1565 domain-containing protein n=1 Tax=Hymenobacter sp. AT01-02 TaxID=1571877 RepID=UPI00128F239F
MHYSLLSYAATALCSGLLYSPLLAQPLPKVAASALYVNDLSQTGDLFTSAAGSDATGTGSTSAPFATVAAALSAADAGTTTIYIDAGTYSERVVLSKNISLQGAGTATNVPASATVFNGGLADGTQANEVGIYIATSGGTAAAPVVLADFTVR